MYSMYNAICLPLYLSLGGAKPSNLRAKFENLAKSSEESNQIRTAEQKKLREDKDRFDRETAAKKTVSERPIYID